MLQAITHHRKLDKIVNSAAAFTALDDFLEEDGTAKAERRAANAAARRAARTRVRNEQGQPSETPKRPSGRREWRQFNPLSLRDAEAPASLYLISSEHHRALKIGVTAGARMDQFEVDGWEVLRVWRFTAGYDAMEVEERVLDRWRNVLSTRAPVAPEDMPDHGYSETTRDGRGARSDIIAFIVQCHEEMALEPELAADRVSRDDGWWEDWGE